MRGRRIAFALVAWLLAVQSTGCRHAPDRKVLASQARQTFVDLSEQFTEWVEARATEIEQLSEGSAERTEAADDLEHTIIRWQALAATLGDLLDAYERGDTSKLERLETWLDKAAAMVGSL